MNPKPDPRYASAERPVNRRTASPHERVAAATQAPPARVRQQLQSAQARRLLGAPLARQLSQQSSHRSAAPAHHALLAVMALAPLGSGAGAVGAVLGWQQASVIGMAAGVALFIGGATATAWALRARRRARPDVDAAPTRPVFEPEALAQLDRVMGALAPQLPAETLARLVAIKSVLVRMAPLLATARTDEHFTPDDRLYIAECVRRYLPDLLQAWLAVPAHLRTEGAEPSAQALLDEQLDLLHIELRQREQKLGRGAAEPLLRQQRFLKAKQQGRD